MIFKNFVLTNAKCIKNGDTDHNSAIIFQRGGEQTLKKTYVGVFSGTTKYRVGWGGGGGRQAV